VTAWHRRNRERWAERLEAVGVSPELAGPLGVYLELLGRWGGAVDLLGKVDEDELVVGHVLESLAGRRWVAGTGTLLDLGSGNGFPAVPLLVGRAAPRGVLLEPRERRWAFLREVVRELELPAEVVRERVQGHRRTGYDVVTVRGVGIATWLPHAERVLRPGGRWLWWTTVANADRFARQAPGGHVLTFPLPDPGRGVLAVWRRRST
jgi:16S rRNA (guanine527-N7)-methyltransferase